jgi:hypothetical protein
MSKVGTDDPIKSISGKLRGDSRGYFYVKNGKQFYRAREENYQQAQSPRQKWNSAAFAYAHKQLRLIELNPETRAQLNADYEATNHIAPNGKAYPTAHAWKFNFLIYEYKSANPLDEQ